MAKKLQIIGTRGKSAYQYALDGGYTGSEAEFKEKMARELEVAYDYEDLDSKILATAIKVEASGTTIDVSDSANLPILSLTFGDVGSDITEMTISLSDGTTVQQTVTIPVPVTDDGLEACTDQLTMCYPRTLITNTAGATMTLKYIADPQLYIDSLASS